MLRMIFSLLGVIRPHIVIGGILGYSLGVLFPSTKSRLDPVVVLLAYVSVLFTDLSTHYSNDYFDRKLDEVADWKPFGGNNVLIEQPSLDSWVISTSILFSIASLIIAAFLTIFDKISWLFPGLILAGNLLGWGYSSPLTYLKARGLGELAISFFTGIIVPTSGYLAAVDSVSSDFLLFVLPLVLYGFVLSVYLEIPDFEVDKEHEINNLVVRFGIRKISRLCTVITLSNIIYYAACFIPSIPNLWLIITSLPPFAASAFSLHRGFDSRDNIASNAFLVIISLFVFIIGMNIILLFLP
jgi:1,4-dihydroxy-2-naphthoate octaprenyltransferase